MRKIKKRMLFGGLLCLGIACITAGCTSDSCASNNGSNNTSSYEQIAPEPIEYYLELNQYEIENLVIGDTAGIIASYVKKDGIELSCYSKDPTVATVKIMNDYNIEIAGYKEGNTTVVVEYGEFKKEVAVSVGTNGILPALEFSTNVQNGLSVFFDSTYEFDSYVTFNGKVFEDYEVSYQLEDDTFGTFDGETLTVGNKFGTTNITVTASWRGVQSALLTKTFPLTVDVPVNVKINGGYVNEFTLYTVESHGGETYETEQSVTPTIMENGDMVNNFTVSIENHQAGDGSEKQVASYEGGKLKALHFGSCDLVVRYNSQYIGEKTFHFNVDVVRPLATYGENIEKFSILDGDLPIEEIFGSNSVTLLSATQGKWPLTLDGNKVLGVEAQEQTRMSEETITLWSDKVGYTVTVEAYQKVLRTAEDFSVLATSTSGTKIKGYYFLENDIEAFVLPYSAESSFDGVFDGNGKTIKVKPVRKGIFGVLNGTLKNVNIVVEELNSSTPYTCVAVCFNMNDNAFVENVNIKVAPKSAVNGAFTVFGSMTTKSKLKNVVVEIAENVTAGQSNGYGILGYFFSSHMKGAMDVGGTYAGLVQDVYIISNTAKHLMYVMSSPNEADNYVVVASNDANNADLISGAPSVTVVAGAKRYDSIAAMQEEKLNLDSSGFDAALWDVSSGFPIWKNAPEQYARFLVNGYDTQNISLSNDHKTETITFNMVQDTYKPTLTIVSGTCVTVNGDTITARISGTAIIEASYTLNGVTYKKEFNVTVDLSTNTQTLEEKFYVEQPSSEYGADSASSATTLSWDGLANGTAAVILNGVSIEPVVEDGEISIAWTLFANAGVALGETVSLKVVDASKTAWILDVMYVTQAIETEEEFRDACNVLRNQNYEGRYYVLVNNIDCTDITLLGGTEAWGNLRSTFDGQGYYVNNLYVGEFGIFGANINGGVLKNIAFTNVNSTAKEPVLIGTGGKANIRGRMDNVYVSAACGGLTLYKAAQSSFKAWGYFNAVILENCAGVYAGNSGVTGTISTNSLYMISATETSVAADCYATNTTKAGVNKYEYLADDTKYGGMYWYASYELMKEVVSLTAVASQPTIAPFNDCWDLTNGYPVWKNLPAASITITEKQYVEQPTAEYGTDTAAGYSALALAGVQDETVFVSINGGVATTMNVSDGAVQIPWTAFADAGVTLGQTVPMVVKAVDGMTWYFNEVMYVTQAIETEEEFRAVCNDLRNKNYTGRYYVLANNIDCIDTTLLGGTESWGSLVSTFDGQGYYVNNLYVGAWGIFGANVNGGTLKNIAFTNVNSTENNPVLFGTGGGSWITGQISNVYVSATCDGLTLYKTAQGSFKAWGYFNAVVLENCAGVYAGNSSATGTISTNSLYMISATETSVAADRYATNTTKADVNTYEYLEGATKYGGIYWYASYEAMAAANISSTAVAGQPTIAYFNECWNLTNGSPVWGNLPKA